MHFPNHLVWYLCWFQAETVSIWVFQLSFFHPHHGKFGLQCLAGGTCFGPSISKLSMRPTWATTGKDPTWNAGSRSQWISLLKWKLTVNLSLKCFKPGVSHKTYLNFNFLKVSTYVWKKTSMYNFWFPPPPLSSLAKNSRVFVDFQRNQVWSSETNQ